MRLLHAASEAVPYFKTGGLADVVGALAASQADLGEDILLCLPLYRGQGLGEIPGEESLALSVPLGDARVPAALRLARHGAIRVCFVDCPPFFERTGLYGDEAGDYKDNDRRFAFFSRAVLEAAKALDFRPDAVHVHDWQTGLIPAYLKRLYAGDPFFSGATTVFTVHNMAYQGNFPPASLSVTGLGREEFVPDSLEFYGRISLLKAGLVFSDLITTVSPTYARQIRESGDYGAGMEGVLRKRAGDLFGILNGIDTAYWNPETDPLLVRRYSAANALAPEGKSASKRALVKESLLDPKGQECPLVGIVSRLDHQKGLDVALEALEPAVRGGSVQLAVIGKGEPGLKRRFAEFAAAHPGRVLFFDVFEERTAHRIYAASDIFLMPSRFEPCGLGQMIAMRYGAVPVASRTGGLVDTVFEPLETGGDSGNGFLAEPASASDLRRALDRAIHARRGPLWPSLVKRGMSADYSWKNPARAYLDLYSKGAGRKASASRP